MASRFFLSYRREDSAGYTGRIFDALVEVFGEPAVFMDIDTIAPGQDFVQVIDDTLTRCEVALVIIGPNWLHASDKEGRQRLFNDDDFVRMEIEGALTHDIRTLPVLVGGAAMPAGAELPPSIASLARRHAFEMSDRRWHSDMRDLVAALQRSSGAAAAAASLYAPPPPPPLPEAQPAGASPAWSVAQGAPAPYSAQPLAPQPPPLVKRSSGRTWLIVGAVVIGVIIVLVLISQAVSQGTANPGS